MTVALHHVVEGPPDAPVVVLGGSLGSDLHMWDPQAATLRTRLRVVRYDHRGHGGTPAPPGPYRLDELGADLLALLDRLQAERVHLVGLSLGGMVAMWLAAHAPERVERLVLACTAAHYPDPQPWHARAAAARTRGTGALAPELVPSRWFTPEFARRQPALLDQMIAMMAEVDDEGYAGCCEAIAGMDLRPHLPRITAPTLVIAGADDLATPPQQGAAIAEAVPRAELAVVPRAAHLANVEQPEAVTRLIMNHLAAMAADAESLGGQP